MESDDIEYKKNVRSMSLVLAAIVITIFSAIFIPPYVFKPHNVYLQSVSEVSPSGFTLHLTVNSTTVPPSGSVLMTGWINSSSAAEDINASNAWALPPGQLWGRLCTSGWPIGLGVMEGHYTSVNYTLGTPITIPTPRVSCPVQAGAPSDFLFKKLYSSEAIVTLGGSPQIWILQTSLSFRQFAFEGQLHPGIYTAIMADEWGDVLTTNFLVS